MGAYILRRVLLMIPAILGIMAISFAVIQFAPGGPVEQVIAKCRGKSQSMFSLLALASSTRGRCPRLACGFGLFLTRQTLLTRLHAERQAIRAEILTLAALLD